MIIVGMPQCVYSWFDIVGGNCIHCSISQYGWAPTLYNVCSPLKLFMVGCAMHTHWPCGG